MQSTASLATPWNQRTASHELHLAFRRLLRVHQLTLGWAESLEPLPQELAQRLHLLRALGNFGGQAGWQLLEQFLDDTSPEAVLERLSTQVWLAHAEAVSQFPKEPVASPVAEIAANRGARAADEDWAALRLAGPAERRENLRKLVLTLSSTPFAHPALVVRATAAEARIELLQCAHQSAHARVRERADRLCAAHLEWLRAFASRLCPLVRIEGAHSARTARCQLGWTLSG